MLFVKSHIAIVLKCFLLVLLFSFGNAAAATTALNAATTAVKTPAKGLKLTKKKSDYVSMVQAVGQLAGALDHFYYEDIPNEKTTRRMTDALWKCYSSTGGLPDKADHEGVLIDGAACPIRYVRGVAKNNTSGFVNYSVIDNDLLDIVGIENYASNLKFSHTSSNAGSLHEMNSDSEFQFLNNDNKLYLKLNHSLFVSSDQKKTERRTDYHFALGSQSVFVLSYQVQSEEGRVEKSCFIGRNKINCDDWRRHYGYLESLAGW